MTAEEQAARWMDSCAGILEPLVRRATPTPLVVAVLDRLLMRAPRRHRPRDNTTPSGAAHAQAEQ